MTVAKEPTDFGMMPVVETAGARNYLNLLRNKLTPSQVQQRYSMGSAPSAPNLVGSVTPDLIGTADNLERSIASQIMRGPDDSLFGSVLTGNLSQADRVAGDMDVPVQRGIIDPYGTRIPDLLPADQREYLESGGEAGSYLGALGLQSTPMPARPGYGALATRMNDSTESKAAWLAETSPAAVKALAEAGMHPDQVATAHNVFVARAAADIAMKYLEGGETAASLQTLAALPIRQRLMAVAFVDAQREEAYTADAAVQAEEVAQEEEAGKKTYFNPTTGQVVTPMPGADGLGGRTVVTQGAWANPDIDVLGRLIDATLYPVMQTIHATRAATLAPGGFGALFGETGSPGEVAGLVTPAGGETPDMSNPIARLGALWNATTEGFISQNYYDTLVGQYGKADTDIMISYYEATQSDDDAAMPQFWQSIEADPRAQAMLTSAMRGENVGGDTTNGAELFAAVAAGDQGNLGNLAATSVGLDPDTVPFAVARDVTNVASWFVLDPVSYANIGFKALNLARYGMTKALAAKGGSISRVILENKGVNRTYEQFGRSLEGIKAERDAVKRNALMDQHVQRFTGPEARFFNHVHTEVGLERGLFTAQDWATYYGQIDDAERLARGGGVSIKTRPTVDPSKQGREFLDQYSPAARQDAAMRAGVAEGVDTPAVRSAASVWLEQVASQSGNRNLYVPHMTAAKAYVMEQTRGLVMPVESQRVAIKAFESVMGPNWRSLPQEEQAAAFTRALDNPDVADALGFALSDLKKMSEGGKRTFVARVMDRLFPGDRGAIVGWVRREKGADGEESIVRQKGWQRKRAYNAGAGLGESFARSRDQWRRLMTRLPDIRHGVDVRSAKDADKVFQLATAAGVGKDAAGLMRLMWIEGTAAQRQNMMIGLTRTFLKASGVHAVSPTAEREILDMMTGIRSGELHAPEQIYRFGGKMADLGLAASQKRDELGKAAKAAYEADPAVVRVRTIEARIEEAKSGKVPTAGLSPDDIDMARGLQSEVKELEKELAGFQKRLAAAEKGPSKAGSRRAAQQAMDDWLDEVQNTVNGAGQVTRRQILDSLGDQTPAARKGGTTGLDAVDQRRLYEGYLPKRWATMWRDGNGNGNGWSENAAAKFLYGDLEESVRHDWTAIAESAEQIGGRWYVPVPWVRQELPRLKTGAVDGLIPEEELDFLLERIAAQQADIAMAREWLLANPGAVAAAVGKNGKVDPGAMAVLRQELSAARKEAKSARARYAVPSVDDVRRELMKDARKPGGPLEAGSYSPSVVANGKSSALYLAQTEDRMGVVNFAKLDHYTARTSMLNALLFNNRGGQFVTDMWVLGTLYGPRFQLRNGLEDVGMYAMTGGKLGAFVRGRRVSQAIDSAVAREDMDFAAKKAAFDKAQKERVLARKRHEAGDIPLKDLEDSQAAFEKAEAVYTASEAQFGRHAKLGIVRTALTGLSERATYVTATGMERDGVLSRVAQFLVPTTSRFERRDAALKGREAVADLAARSVLRQKLVFASPNDSVGKFYQRLRRAKTIDDLSPADRQMLKFEDDLLRSEYGYQYKDEAAEVTMHQLDATLPAANDMGDVTYLDGDLYRRVWMNGGYGTATVKGRKLNDVQARAMTSHLRFMTERYTLNQVAMRELPAYWKALNRAGSADEAARAAVVDSVLRKSRSGRDWVLVRERFRLVDDQGERALVERMLDDMAYTFTGRDGSWNQDLWRALRHEDDAKMPYFSLGDDVENPAVHEVDFMAGKFDHPESLLVLKGEPALVKHERSLNQKISAKTWEPMGRSLARMTRNPIWYANYTEARLQMRPLEAKYAEIFGEEMAAKMVTNTAAERAYYLTMAYVDNPAVRSNLAWQVRNVARYYRAQEDFARRMIRMTKYEPAGWWKATLAWQASQDVGFVHKDQYGDEYFVYPMSAPALAVMQQFTNMTGFTNSKFGVAPVAFGGKVQWLSPSMDPGQWLPSLSSPWTAVSLQPLLRSMPVAQDFFKGLERAAFGDISADTTVDTSFDGPVENFVGGVYNALPPALKKLQALTTSALQGDVPGSLGYRMTTKTLMAMAAAGNMPTQRDWAENEAVQDEFLEDLQKRTIEMSLASLIFGLFAPASPQYMEDTASIAARKAGYEVLKPAFRDMIQGSIAGGSTWDEAYVKWMTAHPEDGIFAVSMTAGSKGGYITPTMENVDYLKQNMDVWDANPKGMALFMPDGKTTPDDDLKALQALRMYNASEYKPIADMAMEMVAVRSYVEWKALNLTIEQAGAETQRYDAMGETTQDWRDHTAAAAEAKATLRARRPGLSYRLYGKGVSVDTDRYRGDAMQVVEAGRELAKRGNKAAQATLPLIDAYTQFLRDYRDIQAFPGRYDDPEKARSEMSDIWKDIVGMWTADAPEGVTDEQKATLVWTFTRALNPNWEVDV